MKKMTSLLLALVMLLALLSGCAPKEAEPAVDEIVDAAVKAALDASAATINITIEADGKKITVEDAAGKSIQQILDEAGIQLNEGDTLSVSPYYIVAGDVALQVLRRCAVTVSVPGEDPENPLQYSLVLVGGTVADALAAAGITLSEDQTVTPAPETPLEEGMQILISVVESTEET